MTVDEFRQSLSATEPPAGLTHALAGLWWNAKGDWKRAHESAQQDEWLKKDTSVTVNLAFSDNSNTLAANK